MLFFSVTDYEEVFSSEIEASWAIITDECNFGDITKLLKDWAKSFPKRQNIINEKRGDISRVFTELKVLKEIEGFQLINQDFKTMALSRFDFDEGIWYEFIEGIVECQPVQDSDKCGLKLDQQLVNDDFEKREGKSFIIKSYTIIHTFLIFFRSKDGNQLATSGTFHDSKSS